MRLLIAVFLIVLQLSCCSCAESWQAEQCMDRAEACMEDSPELALQTLDSLGRDMLGTRKVRARYSLLYSMALDKNYIDVDSDSIIAPAVRYYRHHGSPDEKLKALYYKGIVLMNAGDMDGAMKEFTKAELYADSAEDYTAVGRLYKVKMELYQDVYDYNAALVQASLAKKYYQMGKDTARYFNAVNDIVVLSAIMKDSLSVDKHLEVLSSNLEKLNDIQVSHYYGLLLNRSLANSLDNVECVLSDYLSQVQDETQVNWITVSDAYVFLQKYDSALNALEMYLSCGGVIDAAYYWTLASVYENIGQMEKALVAYKNYLNITDDKDLEIFKADTKFIEERYIAELKSVRLRLYTVIATLVLLLLVFILFILGSRIRKILREKELEKEIFNKERKVIIYEKEKVEAKCQLLKDEKKDMEKVFNSLKAELNSLKKIRKDKSLDKEIILSVERRLNVLNMFVLSKLSGSFVKIAYEELDKLIENREEFLDSTFKTFQILHPLFISYLDKHNLSKLEIGCCCLYCIGFNASEVSEYLNRKSIYNINGSIRHKLQLTKKDAQISVFLRQKMEELY